MEIVAWANEVSLDSKQKNPREGGFFCCAFFFVRGIIVASLTFALLTIKNQKFYMKKILIVLAVLILAPQSLFAQTTVSTTTSTNTASGVVLKDPGLVPGDLFYFADRWLEALNEFVTFREESKAKLALEHAQERASEIAVVLQTKGIMSDEIKNTKRDFDNEIMKASEILNAQGRAENNEDLDVSNKMLKQAYRNYHKDLNENEKKLSKELDDAVLKGDTGLQGELIEKIRKTKEEKDLVLNEGALEDEEGDDLSDDKVDSNVDGQTGNAQSAEIHVAEIQIENAKRTREQFIALAKVHSAEASLDTKNALAEFDALLQKANTALGNGDAENAKEFAKDAEKVLNDARDDLNNRQLEDEFFKDDKGR